MPLYNFKCVAIDCGHEFEDLVRIKINPDAASSYEEVKCPICGSDNPEKQVTRSTTFILKGDGWAADGYAIPQNKSSHETS